MCGIYGILNFNKGPVDQDVLKAMSDVLKHRGPDDEGIYINANVGLGHRRLAIIDLDTGHQPMHNEDKTISIVFNGEIYNFKDLKQDLEKKGHRFSTKSDAEVIIHLYEDYGTGCLKYLRGMFAFALWDGKKEKLFLARDRLGQKPLCYTEKNNQFIFASEIKAVLKVPGIQKKVNLEAMHHYLTYQYVPSPSTMFEGIKKLPPAHFLVWEKGKITIARYWELDFQTKVNMAQEDYERHIFNLLEESVKLRLISDVPVGAFLSGGIDSTIIVGIMAKLLTKPIKTFSIGFEERAYNELKFAGIAAKHFGTDHHEFIVKPDVLKILPKLIWHYNEPFADSSAIPTYYVAQKTREHVTVALNGDGGDECFGGYPRYQAVKLAQFFDKIPDCLGKKFMGAVANSLPESSEQKTLLRRTKRFFQTLTLSPGKRYIHWISSFDNERKNRLYSHDMKKAVGNIDSCHILEDIYSKIDSPDFLDKTFYVDIMSYLPDDLLVKVDIAAMANSLEARSPFLDHKLMESCAAMPSNLKLKGFTGKYILKKTFKDILPQQILRRKKMGFGVPISRWFRNELKDYLSGTLLDNISLKRSYFNQNYVKQLLGEHSQGRCDHGTRLWALLNLELWHRMFID